MNSFRQLFIAFSILVCGGALLAAEQAVPFDAKWNLPPGAQIVKEGGKPVLRVSIAPGSEKNRQVVARCAFDLSRYRGHRLDFVYEVKAANVSKPAEFWNGIKLMLHYRNKNQELWPDTPAAQKSGTYDWTPVTVSVWVKSEAKGGELMLGLQNSSGTVEIRSVKVFDRGIADPYAAPVPVPANFRAEYTSRVAGLPRLRGVMSPNSYRPKDMEDLADWNANLIRWQIKRNWDTPGADRDIPEFHNWLLGKLDILEQVLDHCGKLGIKVVVDMHGAPGARMKDRDLTMLHDRKYADAFIDCWREIATRFKGNPTVWAYDLVNEPSQKGEVPNENYLAVQYRAAKAIREIDPDVPIIVAANQYDIPDAFAYLQPLPLPNIIYEVHLYQPLAFTHNFNTASPVTYPGMISGEDWNRETVKKHLAPVREFEKKYGARIYVGEFSAVRHAPGAAKYLEDVISVFEEYGWDWSYHAFRESPLWDVEYSNDPGKTEKASVDTDRKQVLLKAFRKNTLLKPADAAGSQVDPARFPVPDLNSRSVKSQQDATRRVSVSGGIPTLTFSLKKPGDSHVLLPLDHAALAGKTVVFSADIALENVSSKPKPWNGVKLMLIVTGADGRKSYPQASVMDGSSGWTRYCQSARIPADVRAVNLLMGLENVAGTAKFRKLKLEEAAPPTDYCRTVVTGWTGRDNSIYAPGEPMKFCFRILDAGKSVPGRLRVLFSGDDGSSREEEYALSADRPLEVTAVLAKPGFMMVSATLVSPQGVVIKRKDGAGNLCAVQYGLAAGVEVEKLRQGAPEPGDFDEFWTKSKAELNSVPLRVLERKFYKTSDGCDIYDVKIAAPGPRPAVGWLSVPKDAKKGSLPIDIRFDGYAVHAIQPMVSSRAIVFYVNAHGIENNREADYYKALSEGELRAYGFDDRENEKPDSCYFKYMILRDLRALEYTMTLPEWDGKTVHVIGGSQGAFQAAAVAALAPAATRCELTVPWLCDLGGIKCGRTRGWRPNWQAGLGYYDPVNFARRIQCPVRIQAGLSDWVCPPSGVCVFYNNLNRRGEMVLKQGRNHAHYLGYDGGKVQQTVFEKN